MITVLMGVLMIIAGSHTASLILEIPNATWIMRLDFIVAVIVAIAGVFVIIDGLFMSAGEERKLISESKEMSSEELRNLCKDTNLKITDEATFFKVDHYYKTVKRNVCWNMGLAEKDADIYVIHFSGGTYEVEVEK